MINISYLQRNNLLVKNKEQKYKIRNKFFTDFIWRLISIYAVWNSHALTCVHGQTSHWVYCRLRTHRQCCKQTKLPIYLWHRTSPGRWNVPQLQRSHRNTGLLWQKGTVLETLAAAFNCLADYLLLKLEESTSLSQKLLRSYTSFWQPLQSLYLRSSLIHLFIPGWN
jgi:hypothetical protein